jgi:tRNA(Arg) A34 adenosine deaminase TadA
MYVVMFMNKYVDRIIELAKIAYDNDDIPVGAIVVKNNEIIGEGFNTRNSFKSVIGHAEIDAIEMACKHIGDWRLDDCIMYVTLAPCMMCTGAIIESRINNIYYLCDRTNVLFNSSDYINIEKIDDADNITKYTKLLQLFFENKRNK